MANGAQPVGFSFRCNLCEDDHIGVPIVVNSKHSYVVDEECASDMVVPLIERALASEYSYPPRWGNITVDYKHFLHLLPQGFRERFRQKRVEYRTPLSERIYCQAQREKVPGEPLEQCGTFLRQKSSKPAQRRTGGAKVKNCPVCKDPAFSSCTYCGDLLGPDDLAVASGPYTRRAIHRCSNDSNNDDEAAFKGLVLGVDYQRCPGCGLKVQLSEACNHLTCLGHSCRTQFCAICGKPATHDSDHWQVGKPCPRWNRPNDVNAGYDIGPEAPPGIEVPDGQEERDVAERAIRAEGEQWRQRPWSHALVRDETYINHLLAMLTSDQLGSAGAIPFDLPNLGLLFPNGLDVMLLRRLLTQAKEAVRIVALFRAVGVRLEGEQLTDLRNRYRDCLRRIRMAWGLIEEDLLFRFPRVVDLLQRTVDKLHWLKEDINRRLLELAAQAPNAPGVIHREDVPVLRNHLMAEYLEAYYDLERARRSMIRRHVPRPAGLGAAIDMIWLMYSNSKIPKLFIEATSPRQMYDLMVRFHVQHEELQVHRRHVLSTLRPKHNRPMRYWEMFVSEREDVWTKISEAYDDAAEKFMALIPKVIVDTHRRGWYVEE